MLKKLSLIAITLLICLTFNPAIAQVAEVTFEWTHSGIGMDRFVVAYGSTSGGPYPEEVVMMVEDLTQGEGEIWEGTYTIDVPDNTGMLYFVIYAQNAQGGKSDISNEVASDLSVPDTPMQFKVTVKFV